MPSIKIKLKGFTLVEILVAISIIGIIGAVAIPGVRNFSVSQGSDNATLQVLNVLKLAQSSAASSIKCPNNNISESWIVSIKKDSYLLRCRDTLGTVSDPVTYTYTPDGKDSTGQYQGVVKLTDGLTDTCAPSTGFSTDLVFTSGAVRYLCNLGGNYGNPPFDILIKNSSGQTLKTINIESGGVIRIKP